MTTWQNGGFETADANDGFAAGWRTQGRFSAELLAGYRENTDAQLTRTKEFDHADWIKTAVTVTPDAIAAPDGTMTADQILETVANSEHHARQAVVIGQPGFATFACYLKASGQRYAGLRALTSGGSQARCYFDFTNLEFSFVLADGPGVFTKASVEAFDAGDDWWLITMTFDVNGPSVSVELQVILSNDGSSLSYAGNVLKGVYAWGAFYCRGQVRGWEDYELGWGTGLGYVTSFVIGVDTSAAVYSAAIIAVPPQLSDGFEIGWNSNQSYRFAIGTIEDAVYSGLGPQTPGLSNFEPLNGWQNNFADFVMDTEVALFGGEPDYEGFESGWQALEYFFVMPLIGGITYANFDGAVPEAVEDFEETKAPVPFTADGAVLTSPGHGFLAGQKVRVSSDGRLPEPLSTRVDYWVKLATSTFLELAATSGGTTIVTTTGGGGNHYLAADRSLFWVDFMVTG